MMAKENLEIKLETNKSAKESSELFPKAKKTAKKM
jgi:hypothetical protein